MFLRRVLKCKSQPTVTLHKTGRNIEKQQRFRQNILLPGMNIQPTKPKQKKQQQNHNTIKNQQNQVLSHQQSKQDGGREEGEK